MNFTAKTLSVLLLFVAQQIFAAGAFYSDTVQLDLKATEKRFLEQNLDLLIAKTNIDEAKGYLLQSKLFDNPEVDLNRELYNFETKKFLSHSKNTQFDVQYNQLITTGGKYFKGIQIAKQKVKLSEYDFYDLLRSLKLDLRENFYELTQDQQKAAVVSEGIKGLNKLIEATQVQVDKGYVAKKELIRLQSLLLSYQTEQTEIANKTYEDVSDLKQLLNYTGSEYLVAIPDTTVSYSSKIENIIYDSLETTALTNRYDLQAANLSVAIGKNEVQLEKMHAVPDLTMGVQYDRAGTGGDQYTGLLVGLPLPLWNWNQGNIKAAKAEYAQVQLEQKQKYSEVHNNLMEEYGQFLNQIKLYQGINKEYYNSFEDIYKNIYESYKNRTIGLVEFLEYFDSYKDTKFNLIDVQVELQKQAQHVNFETGKDIF